MECPNCGNIMRDTEEVCIKCNFNFNDTLSCPYKVSGRCIFTQETCNIKGLGYEECSIYLHKAGLA